MAYEMGWGKKLCIATKPLNRKGPSALGLVGGSHLEGGKVEKKDDIKMKRERGEEKGKKGIKKKKS